MLYTNQNIIIQETLDGSNTLFLPDLNETYHSLNGALSESQHVYIHNGLNLIKASTIHVLEIGFGTGLNALLSIEHGKNRHISYSSIEPYPVDRELLIQYYEGFKSSPFETKYLSKMDESNSEFVTINSEFQFRCFNETLQSIDLNSYYQKNKVNLVYYDAFAPSRQADMWEKSLFEKLYEVMDDQAVLTTYCAQGQFKRTLKSIGFELQHPSGANGKREMTIAIKK